LFEDVQAIIFLAPISAFDQMLAENATVNRLADSFGLFAKICKERTLRESNIVLFLNKVDLLRAKLAAGVRFNKYVVRYGDRPNTFDSICTYIKSQFVDAYKTHRKDHTNDLYVHFTAVTDIRSTRVIFESVQDSIIRGHLRASQLI